MPRKAKNPPVVSEPEAKARPPLWTANDAPWGGFINLRLEESQKAEFYAWLEANPAASGQLLDDLLSAGAKIGLSYDDENECCIATITGRLLPYTVERFCVTTRAGTLSEVIALMVWKHFYLADGDYSDFRPRSGRLDRWG